MERLLRQILEIRAITVAGYALPSRRRRLDLRSAPHGELTDTGRPTRTRPIEYENG